MVEYLKAKGNFGMHIEISREDVLLDTGGGLKKAAWFFEEEPFILHNVDVITTIDLQRMLQFHSEYQALATLAVQDRKTSRYLLFDDLLRLRGRQPTPHPQLRSLAFAGIHVISPRLFRLMTEEGAFSIIDTYVRLAEEGEKILAFRADEYKWRDVGRLEHLAQVARDLGS